jgi:hypothetical protein
VNVPISHCDCNVVSQYSAVKPIYNVVSIVHALHTSALMATIE